MHGPTKLGNGNRKGKTRRPAKRAKQEKAGERNAHRLVTVLRIPYFAYWCKGKPSHAIRITHYGLRTVVVSSIQA